MMTRTFSLVLLISSFCMPASSQLPQPTPLGRDGFVQPELVTLPSGKFEIRPSNAQQFVASGLEISSENGILVSSQSAAPFAFVLGNLSTKITLASIPDLVIDREFVTDVGWDVDRVDDFDVEYSFGEGGNAVTLIAPLPIDGDCNFDGTINRADLTCLRNRAERDIVLSRLTLIPGDLDGNGNVSFDDYLTLSSNYQNGRFSYYSEGDINVDGKVDLDDFEIMRENFGKKPTNAVAVPEPEMTCVLVWCVLASMWSKRPRLHFVWLE